MLKLFALYNKQIADREVFCFTIWFHDIVYRIGNKYNEDESASYAIEFLTKIEFQISEQVVRLIKLTKHQYNEKNLSFDERLLLDFDLGMMGAVGTRNSDFDTWVLTPEIARDIYLRPKFGGHEMIITGYDDEAVATDDQGRKHKGLFTLRNSWGDKIGDKGNFYMSYDYFKVLVIEAQRIRTMPADGGVDSITA